MKYTITNIHVSPLNSEHSTQYALGWNSETTTRPTVRYHVWLDRVTLEHRREYELSTRAYTGRKILYKNPLDGPHFETRDLDGESLKNAVMIESAIKHAVNLELFKRAEEEELIRQQAEESKRKDQRIEAAKMRHSGPMYELLKKLVDEDVEVSVNQILELLTVIEADFK